MHERIKRFYAALSRTNGAIVRARSPESLFQEICAICVEYGHAKMAYVVQVDESGTRAMPVAAAGPADRFLRDIALPLDPGDPAGNGPIAVAIRTGTPQVINDLHADPRTLPWRDRAVALGSQATAAFPIRRGDRVVGALSLHIGDVDSFDAPLTELLAEMAGDISYALDNLDADVRRRDAERASASGFERFRKIFEASPAATVIWTAAEGRLLDANPAFCAFLGYERAELVGRTHAQLKLWRERADRMSYVDRLRVEQHVRDYETQFRVRAGEMRDVLVSAETIDFLDQPCVLTIISDITERKRYETRMRHLATHDGLTNLPNRTLFHDRLTQALAHARRNGTPLGVLFIDLDRMKTINDGLGHETGDIVLQAIGGRLKGVIRDGDTVARLGGDQFLILLSSLTHVADAYVVAQKIIDRFEWPLAVTGHEIHVTASVGVSIYPQDGADSGELIANADAAMYRAKEMGGNGYQFYTSEMQTGRRRQLDIETQLRRALDEGQLRLAYQPKVAAVDGRISGTEALLRWSHPVLGEVPPASFIPIAEDNGLIVAIGEWVLRTACAQNVAWQRAGLVPLPVAVNVSARQLMQQDFVAMVRRVLQETGLAPRWLEFEITESVIAQDIENVVALMGELSALGVRFAIDDFGTGYSSLSYLKRFRIDRLKIDQSFVRQVHSDPGDGAIARAIVSLAKSLDLAVTAEGVESSAQLAFLQALGCDEMQGFYFSAAISAAEFAALMQRGGVLRPAKAGAI